jgi:hypothetical protein
VGAPELDRQAPVPASADVLRELVVLRQRDGISMHKLRERCPLLLGLPVTSHELARRQLDETDRHVAAYEMLKCAVTALIPRSDLSRIAAQTLNVMGGNSNLDQRRNRLQAELYLTDKAYRRLEVEAFTHLAGVLVAADRSPCTGTPGEHLSQIEFDLHVSTSSAQLLQILTLLSFERRQTIRDQLGSLLLEPLPNAQAALQDDLLAHLEGPWAVARHLLAAVLIKAWPPRTAMPTSDLLLFAAGSLSDLLLSNVLDVDYQHFLVARTEQQRFQQLMLVDHERPTDEFYRLKGVNLLQLGAQIERLELDDRWVEVIAGIGEWAEVMQA